jgi:hypothetical protein
MIEQAAVSVVFSNGRNDRSVTGAGRLDVRDPQPGNRIKHATSTYISPCCQERDLRFLGRQRSRKKATQIQSDFREETTIDCVKFLNGTRRPKSPCAVRAQINAGRWSASSRQDHVGHQLTFRVSRLKATNFRFPDQLSRRQSASFRADPMEFATTVTD